MAEGNAGLTALELQVQRLDAKLAAKLATVIQEREDLKIELGLRLAEHREYRKDHKAWLDETTLRNAKWIKQYVNKQRA